MRFGYGRVSTRDQHTESQQDALLAAGVDAKNIYVEKISTRITQRPQLEAVRKMLRAGDTLVITKIDRLARSLLDLITIANELREAGIELEVLSGTFNRADPMGEAFFQMTGVFAQLERDLIRQRTMDGLAAARARGRAGGRKQKLSASQQATMRRMYEATDPDGKRQHTVAEIAEAVGVHRTTVYDYLRRGE